MKIYKKRASAKRGMQPRYIISVKNDDIKIKKKSKSNKNKILA